jgi:hypothetical protein
METTLTNAELSQQFAEKLSTKRAFIVGVKPTRNPEIKQLEIAQAVELRGASSGTNITALLMGWSDTTILRAWQNIKVEILATLDVRPGDFADDIMQRLGVNGEFNLQLTEYTQETEPFMYNQNVVVPTMEGRTGATPKKNPSTDQVVTYDGNPVFRAVKLVEGGAQHVLLQSDTVARTSVERAFGATSNGVPVEA